MVLLMLNCSQFSSELAAIITQQRTPLGPHLTIADPTHVYQLAKVDIKPGTSPGYEAVANKKSWSTTARPIQGLFMRPEFRAVSLIGV